MDPRLYIYQLRRPRLENPTYNSKNIDNTCFSIYSGGPLDHLPFPPTSRSPPPSQLKEEFTRSRGSSQLSKIGSSLVQLEDRDIYNRQRSKFDIISMQPVGNEETIKKYPKFTLEDKDVNYYRRMGQIKQELDRQEQKNISGLGSRIDREEKNAGMHTYQLDNNKIALDLWQSYQGKKPINPRFSAGMLNHVDEFRSLM